MASDTPTPAFLNLRIVSGTQPVWEGTVKSVTSKNSEGVFDILPLHANFITLIGEEPIRVVTTDDRTLSWNFKQSVMYVNNNEVKIYADFA